MGNAKNKKLSKKRKLSTKSKCRNASDQKENVPKTSKNKLTKSDDGIAMSKQLLLKKSSSRANRRSSSKIERVCANGKPIPSLADLEKMFEDSDDDEQLPNTPIKKTSTPKKQTPEIVSENKLLSPSTINKISERMLDLISNISNPIELLEDVPPPPIIPQKKRKKPEEPYIVGCKDRPQVIRKFNNNFCKGDDEYGVEATAEEPEEPPNKRAKKSKIPKYSKSIFNAHSDEIAERLNKDDLGGLSDTSSDSNKTIEYDPKLLESHKPHSFSPLPSTSKDNETFIKNDELFNESLKDKLLIQNSSPRKMEDEVKIIDIPHDTIVIDDTVEDERPTELQNTSNGTDMATEIIEIIDVDTLENKISQDDVMKCRVQNDNDDTFNDCFMVPSTAKNINETNFNQTIDIDDEYSNINLDYNTFNREPVEIIEIDDVIAENESILDKWKNNDTEKFNKINTVVDVPTTYRNSTTPETNATPSPNHNLNMTNVSDTLSQNTQNNQCLQTPFDDIDAEILTQNTSTPNIESGNAIQKVVDDFFKGNENPRYTNINKAISISKNIRVNNFISICDAILSTLEKLPATKSNSTATCSQPPVNSVTRPVSTKKTRNPSIIDLSQSPDISKKQQTYKPPVPIPDKPEPTRNIGDCPICMDPLSAVGIASTICGHVFCLKCIQAAIKTSGKRCPTCRKVLKGAGGGYHQLYL